MLSAFETFEQQVKKLVSIAKEGEEEQTPSSDYEDMKEIGPPLNSLDGVATAVAIRTSRLQVRTAR